MTSNNLRRRAALVTGAAGGIGASLVRLLAARGYEVHLAGRRLEPLLAVREGLGEGAVRGQALALDVADIAAVRAAVARLPALDLVVNNAAVIGPIAPFTELDPEAWRDCVATNLVGPFNVAQAAMPLLLAGGSGTLINVGSRAADNAPVGWSAYGAGKAGLTALTRALWTEYGPRGLRVFEYRPSLVESGMRQTIRRLDASRRNEDVSALGRPDDAARQIAWLDRPEADRLLGTVVTPEIAAEAMAAAAIVERG